jgi:translation initiation factor IF-1
MPKKVNIKKGAAALFQNGKVIAKAMEEGGTFGAVVKKIGNGGFLVAVNSKKNVLAVPRGLFTKRTMRIEVGQVVILEGQIHANLPLEISARLDTRAEINALIKQGHMSAEILGIAETAGAVVTTAEQPLAKEALFNEEEIDEEVWNQGIADVRGGLKQERKAKETAASIAARLGTLKCGRGKQVDGGLLAGDAADPMLRMGLNEEFRLWRAAKAHKALSIGGGGSTAAPAACGEVLQTEEEIYALEEAESLRKADAEEQAAIVSRLESIAHAEEVRAFLLSRKVKENWDDEEVDLEDL